MARHTSSSPLPPSTNPNDAVPSTDTTKQDVATVLCQHCKRTADNGIRCLGMCVADNDY